MTRRDIFLVAGTVLLLAVALYGGRWADANGPPFIPGQGDDEPGPTAGTSFVPGVSSGGGETPAAPAPTPAPPAGPPGTFVETFDGLPAAPEPFVSPRWDVQVHERGMGVAYPAGELPAMNAQHGPGCEGPAVPHTVDSVPKAVFLCNDHMMTSIAGPGYGAIYITPDQMLDWSAGEAVIEFDISTHSSSIRDWIDLWVQPLDSAMALPFHHADGQPDLNGPPTEYLHWHTEAGSPLKFPRLSIQREGEPRETFPTNIAPLAAGIPGDVDQSVNRQPFRMTISSTRVRFERLASETAPARVYFDYTVADLGFDRGVATFGHHSYNPTKDGAGVAGTWHWDNFRLAPAVPFYLGHVEPRYVPDGPAQTVTFAPAPEGSVLRFSSLGQPRVNGELCDPVTPFIFSDHAHSYLCPIPGGATSATIELDRDGLAKDFAVWAPP